MIRFVGHVPSDLYEDPLDSRFHQPPAIHLYIHHDCVVETSQIFENGRGGKPEIEQWNYNHGDSGWIRSQLLGILPNLLLP